MSDPARLILGCWGSRGGLVRGLNVNMLPPCFYEAGESNPVFRAVLVYVGVQRNVVAFGDHHENEMVTL